MHFISSCLVSRQNLTRRAALAAGVRYTLSCATCFLFACLLLFGEQMIEQSQRLGEAVSPYVLLSALVLSSTGLVSLLSQNNQCEKGHQLD